MRNVFSSRDSIGCSFTERPQKLCRVLCAAIGDQVMCFMRDPMQLFRKQVLGRAWAMLEKKSRDGPDRVEFGLAIHEVFEFGRDVQKRDDFPKRLDAEVT